MKLDGEVRWSHVLTVVENAEQTQNWNKEHCMDGLSRSTEKPRGEWYNPSNLVEARMRVALSAAAGILSALALLLIKEIVFLLSEYRQAFERQELAHKSTCTIVIGPEPEVAEIDFEFPFLCGLGAGVSVALALAVILRYLCSSRVEPASLRVRRVRLNHSEDGRTDESNVAQARISGRRVVSWLAGSFLRENDGLAPW